MLSVSVKDKLIPRIRAKEADIGIIGMGYVGLPPALHFLEAGFSVTGFDIDSEKVKMLNKGESYIRHIPSSRIIRFLRLKNSRGFVATTDMGRRSEMDAILICVPTPLTNKREPDMQYIPPSGNYCVTR